MSDRKMAPHELTIISLWFTTFHVDKKFCLQLFATCATSIIHRTVLCMLWGCLSISFPLSLYTKSNAHWVSTSRPSLSLSYAYIHKKLWSVDLLICEYGRKAYARGSVLWLWWRSIWFEGYFHIRCSFLQSPLNFVIWVYPYLWEVSWLLITCV